MKRPSVIVLTVAMLLAGCGTNDTTDRGTPDAATPETSANDDQSDRQQPDEKQPEPDADGAAEGEEQRSDDEADLDDLEGLSDVEVERNLLTVSVTVPASLLDGQDLDQAVADAEAEGMRDVTVNDDGSLTYKMSRSEHRGVMAEMRESVVTGADEMVAEYESIEDITYNSDFSEFTLVVDRAAYENSLDGFAVLGISLLAGYYQLFDGADMDDYQVQISKQDAATGEVYDTVLMPDHLDA